MATYTLRYWKKRGRGEQVRLLLEDQGIKYESQYLDHEPDSKDNWTKWKAANQDKAMFGSVPVLSTSDGFHLAQGPVILSYLAKKHGFYPQNVEAGALADSIALAAEDIRIGYFGSFQGADANQKYIEAWDSRWGPLLTRILKENGSGFFVGKSATHADYAMFDAINACVDWVKGFPLDKFPAVKEFHATMLARPNIAAYIKSDRAPKS